MRMRRARAGYSYSNSVVYSCSSRIVSLRRSLYCSLLFALIAVVVSPPSTIVMSTASPVASTSSVITLSSGASRSSAAPPATSAPPGASSSSSCLYSHLLRSLDDSTRRQIEATMAQVCNHMLSLSVMHAHSSSSAPSTLPGYQFVLHPLPPPFAASPSPSASIAQELMLSLQLPSYRLGFICSSQLPLTRIAAHLFPFCFLPPHPFCLFSPLSPPFFLPPPPYHSSLFHFSFLLLSIPYVAALHPVIASAPSRLLVPSALLAIPLVQFTSSMPSAPASEPSTISSIASLISPPVQMAPALPQSAMIVSPSLPPVPAKAVEKIVKHQFVEMKELMPDNSALMLQVAELGPNQPVSSGKLREIDDPLTWVFYFLLFWPSVSFWSSVSDRRARELAAYGQVIVCLAQ